jgi:hypothetical protein
MLKSRHAQDRAGGRRLLDDPANGEMPALFTITSSRPKRTSVPSISDWT